MTARALSLLACPVCVGPLVDAGSGLDCPACDVRYPVIRGVPRFLSTDTLQTTETTTRAHFGEEFRNRDVDDADFDEPELVRFLFATRAGIDASAVARLGADHYPTSLPPGGPADLSFLRGKRVLDAGCGPGRFTKIVAEVAAEVVALDFGEHVERAAARTADLPNVTVVQGSVLRPPIALREFDFVFSIGVLHHTADAAGGAAQLCERVAPGGSIAIWVYPVDYWGPHVRGLASRTTHAVLSRLSPRRAMWTVVRVLYPLGKLQQVLARRRWTKAVAAPLFVLGVPRHPSREVMISTIYDRYCPTIITTHSPSEVASWLTSAGLDDVETLAVPSSARASRRA